MAANDVKWGSIPPPEAVTKTMALKRTPAKGTLEFVILSKELGGTYTHYFGGSTIPCAETGCKACEQKCGRRWHTYLHCRENGEGGEFIWESTPNAVQGLVRIQQEGRSLRGVTVRAGRADARANARIVVRANEMTRDKLNLPPERDVRAIMRNIWRLDSTTRYADDVGYENRVTMESHERANGKRARVTE